MAETCIVCLGDLRTELAEDPPSDAPGAAAADASKSDAKKKATRSSSKSIQTDEETIAHLLPCKHDLHNACLKPWVERANSCPICRAKFNMVELSTTVGGQVLDSYAVQDKVQEAELDATMIVEDELFAVEAWEPCMVCGAGDETHELMYCDGCDKAVHVFCAGHDEVPEVWYCESCLSDLEADTGLPGVRSAMRRRPRRRAAGAPRGSRRRDNDAIWARVWQEVSRRLDLDLDFPYDDEITAQRTPQQRRELAHWQRRLEVADDTGGHRDRLRGIAASQLQPARAPLVAEPESQEELRAWNAFNKARESQEAPVSVRRRKRKATASPASPHEPQTSEQPQLKRPRLRRPPMALEQQHQEAAESSHAAAQRNDDRSTFLSSLLKDVETIPTSAGSPGAFEQYNGQYSPGDSSPMRSPTSSGHATPRSLSPSPPPHRPMSPLLSSTIIPLSSPIGATFSPFSPAAVSHGGQHVDDLHHRGRRRLSHDSHQEDSDGQAPVDRASSTSPSRHLSYSAKEEIQRMVKLALGPRYRDKEIGKEQYTDINKSVSRKLYDLVGDASALSGQAERERWQGVAEQEVRKAITVLHFGAEAADGI